VAEVVSFTEAGCSIGIDRVKGSAINAKIASTDSAVRSPPRLHEFH
jgi:hypothetical protein